jgi:hypothetical protein
MRSVRPHHRLFVLRRAAAARGEHYFKYKLASPFVNSSSKQPTNWEVLWVSERSPPTTALEQHSWSENRKVYNRVQRRLVDHWASCTQLSTKKDG